MTKDLGSKGLNRLKLLQEHLPEGETLFPTLERQILPTLETQIIF